MRRFQSWWPVASLAVAIVAFAGCGGGAKRAGGPLTIKGSDTMVILSQRWAETYMASHSGTVVQVTGGGSGTGIAALINGTTDICQASRPMKDDEKQQIQSKYGAPPQEIPVARDGLSIYVNESNPVKDLSLEQLKDLYTGTITNWKQVGGQDAPITLYGRENSSGTYEYFKEHVLNKGDFAASVQTLPGTAAVVNAVAKDAGGIGYGGAAYAKGVREVAVRRNAHTSPVLPTRETVANESYPISRVLFYYTRKAPEGSAKDFIDYVLSDAGQKIVTEVGYFPLH
jgi:phosphate transport system substrate-binding protein